MDLKVMAPAVLEQRLLMLAHRPQRAGHPEGRNLDSPLRRGAIGLPWARPAISLCRTASAPESG